MKTMTRSFAAFEIKAVNESKRTFRGLAATWEKDTGDDIIHRGAFARTLDHWKSSKRGVPLIDQHSYSSIRDVIGKMTDAAETDAGLEAEFQVIEGGDGEEVMLRVKGGFITGLSIGYEAVRWEMEKPEGAPEWERIRHLHELKLFEVSLVVWPMNEQAQIDLTSVKAMLHAARVDDPKLPDAERARLRAELKQIHEEISALLREEEPAGLAPDAPQRLAVESLLRNITLRRLGTAV